MGKKVIRQPRKLPQQERARKTVGVLLQATAQVLVAEGWSKITTNKVAARAGTSIGTLYEYFPSKEALVSAMVEQLAEDLVGKTLQHMDLAMANPGEESVRSWLAAMVSVLEQEADLVRVVSTQIPFFWDIPLVRMLQRRLEGIATVRSQEITRITGKKFTPESVYLMTAIARSTVLQIATDRPAGLDRERLITELADIFNHHFLQEKSPG